MLVRTTCTGKGTEGCTTTMDTGRAGEEEGEVEEDGEEREEEEEAEEVAKSAAVTTTAHG